MITLLLSFVVSNSQNSNDKMELALKML